MDNDTIGTLVIAGILILSFAGMYFGWRGRKRRQLQLGLPEEVPADAGRELVTAEALYVATTIAGEPLNRVATHGLGFRARAVITVTESGVILSRTSSPDIFIPVEDLRSVGQATWTIDRTVESGGLLAISWCLRNPVDPTGVQENTVLDSYLRITRSSSQQPVIAAVQSLIDDQPNSVLHGSDGRGPSAESGSGL